MSGSAGAGRALSRRGETPAPGLSRGAPAVLNERETGGKREFTSLFIGYIFFSLSTFQPKTGILSVCQSSCDFFISLSLFFFFLIILLSLCENAPESTKTCQDASSTGSHGTAPPKAETLPGASHGTTSAPGPCHFCAFPLQAVGTGTPRQEMTFVFPSVHRVQL